MIRDLLKRLRVRPEDEDNRFVPEREPEARAARERMEERLAQSVKRSPRRPIYNGLR